MSTVMQSKATGEVGPAFIPLDEEVWRAWLIRGREKDRQGQALLLRTLKWILIVGLVIAGSVRVMSAAGTSSQLSQYRDFKLGSDLSTIATQTGLNPAQAKSIHLRPALIQELEWRPQTLGWSSKIESVQYMVFSFYNGELFRIVINYDRDQVEGLTAGDIVEAISASYGVAATPPALVETVKGQYGDQEDVVARWQDPDYRFDLIRSSYGSNYRLIGSLRRLEEPVQAAILKAASLDEQEAPQREAARVASEEDAAKAKLEKARLRNKDKFRP